MLLKVVLELKLKGNGAIWFSINVRSSQEEEDEEEEEEEDNDNDDVIASF